MTLMRDHAASRAMRCVIAALGLLATAGACGQAYPEKPIRLLVPYPPGGATDFGARVLAQFLPALLGQSLVVDNRSGAGGNVGTAIGARAAPDGYTLLVISEAPVTINPSVYAKVGYDPLRDIPAITQLIRYPMLVVVHPTLPVASVAELARYATANPRSVRFGHPGVGTMPHLAGELFQLRTRSVLTGVSYKGAGPAIVSLLGNETQVSFASPASALAHVRGARLKALAVTSRERYAPVPELPTAAEAGVADFDVSGWVGLFAPRGVSPKILDRVYTDVVKVLRMQEARDMILGSGSEVSATSTAEFQERIRVEHALWAKVVKDVGIKVE